MLFVIKEILKAFQSPALQDPSCEILFLKLGCRDQWRLLLLYQPPCCIAISLPEFLDTISGLAVEFPRLIFLGGCLASEWDLRWLGSLWSYLSHGPILGHSSSIQDSIHPPDLMFLSNYCQCDLKLGDLLVFLLSWSVLSLIATGSSCVTSY